MPTNTIPLSINTNQIIHIIGIGGIGMSGIAILLKKIGYTVQGSDLIYSYNIERLNNNDINVKIGHHAHNIGNASVVIFSSAIKKNNVELVAAKNNNLHIMNRAESLCYLVKNKKPIVVSGSHGKTTTNSLIGCILTNSNLDPTVISGGIINSHNTNIIAGNGDLIIVEGDESDGAFVKLSPYISVITNIDREHIDFYHEDKTIDNTFIKFINKTDNNGIVVSCQDNKRLDDLINNIKNKNIIKYGITNQADCYAYNIVFNKHYISFNVDYKKEIIKDIKIYLLGLYNVYNALAAISVAKHLNISNEVIKKGLLNFQGVDRRFTVIENNNNKGVNIVNDYAHHPTEIYNSLNAARQFSKNKIIAVVQPHRYTRVRDLFEQFSKCFENADYVFITDIYSAGEMPISDLNVHELIKSIHENSNKKVYYLKNFSDLPDRLAQIIETNDTIIFMGAGSINFAAKEFAASYNTQ